MTGSTELLPRCHKTDELTSVKHSKDSETEFLCLINIEKKKRLTMGMLISGGTSLLSLSSELLLPRIQTWKANQQNCSKNNSLMVIF